ncbi:Sugar transport protein 1 [Euphorbia peplus]|nr:Sugar transport protein 1 [Euphorbia peplus]
MAQEHTGKLTRKAFTTCLIAASGGLLFGYDLAISGGVITMDPFLKHFFPDVYEKQSSVKPAENKYCTYDNQILILFVSSLYIAAVLSSVCASDITRNSGVRTTMLTGGYLFAVGALFNGFAQNLWMLIVGRLLLGFGIGCTNQAVPIYLTDVAPYFNRGTLIMMFQIWIEIGILIGNLSNYFFSKIDGGWGWRLSLGLAIVPAIITITGTLVLPENPHSLIERGHDDKAKQQLMELRGVTNVDREFEDLVEASRECEAVKRPWMNILKGKYRPQLVFAICVPMFQQLTGMNVLVSYSPALLRNALGNESGFYFLLCILSSCNLIAFAMITIHLNNDISGRGFAVNYSFNMFIAYMIGTIVMITQKSETSENGVLISMMVFIGFAYCWSIPGWIVPLPLEIRSVGQSINVAVNMCFTFVIAQVFSPMLCHLKLELFIISTCSAAGMYIFIYFYLPKILRSVTIKGMTEVFKNHPRWRKYYQVEDDHGEKGVINSV